jgi:hypothetical protein
LTRESQEVESCSGGYFIVILGDIRCSSKLAYVGPLLLRGCLDGNVSNLLLRHRRADVCVLSLAVVDKVEINTD